MKSKMSFFNPGIIRQDFKQHGWIGLLFLFGLLFAIPLQLMMLSSNESNNKYYFTIENHFRINAELQTILLIAASILAGIFLFRYVMTKDATDMLHSLPVKRSHLFFNHLTSGVMLLLLPIWITAAVTGVVQNLVSYEHQLTAGSLLEWVGMMSFMALFFFLFSVLVGMMTGMSISQGILTLIFLFLPTGLMLLVTYQLSLFLYGFSFVDEAKLENWSPIIRFISIGQQPFTPLEIALYALLGLAFLAIGYVLYRNRQLEMATQPITFHFLKPIFRYGVAFSVMLVSGSYFAAAQNYELGWIIFGYVIGAIFGYLIAEMVLYKSWRIFNRNTAKGLLGYAIIVAVLVIAIKFDITGFEKRVPQASEIEGIYFGNSIVEMQYREADNEDVFYKDETFIKDVRDLHKQITELQPERPEPEPGIRHVAIAYELEDGSELVREYTIKEQDFRANLKPIFESVPYKKDRYQLPQLDQPVDKITISPTGPVQKRVTITDLKEISEFKQVLREDILDLSYEDMNRPTSAWANIDLLFSNDYRTHFLWEKSYKKVEEWLDERGYLEDARITSEDIQFMEVSEFGLKEVDEPLEMIYPKISSNAKKIEDPAEIKDALRTYSQPEEAYYSNKISTITHIIRFVTKDGAEFYGALTE